jgi:hypothetical protein
LDRLKNFINRILHTEPQIDWAAFIIDFYPTGKPNLYQISAKPITQ